MIFFKQKPPDNAQIADHPISTSQTRGLKSRLKMTRQALSRLFAADVELDQALLDDLEDHLIMADLGVNASKEIMGRVRSEIKSNNINSPAQLLELVSAQISQILSVTPDQPVVNQKPFVLLLVGVNGVGKTTTAARLAFYYQSQGKLVMMAACDTFRAAAIEQLQTWGERLDIPVVAQKHGADAAAVAHDAYQSAKAKKIDLLIIDTAGRQHTHFSLMEQLKKVKSVLQKLDSTSPHETIIVLDAGTGQNALSQVSHFNEITPLTGMVVTKLDGTAKGGVVVALVKKYGLPVRFIGIGEAMDDLRVFNADEFARAMLPESVSAEDK